MTDEQLQNARDARTEESFKQITVTTKKKHGKDFYKKIGHEGGKAKVPKGFAVSGKASEAGKLGGQNRWKNAKDKTRQS